MITLRQLRNLILPLTTVKRHVLIEYVGRTERYLADEFRLTLHEHPPLRGFDPPRRTNTKPYQVFQGPIPVVARSLHKEIEKQWDESQAQVFLNFYSDWFFKVEAHFSDSLSLSAKFPDPGFLNPLSTRSRSDVEEFTTRHCLSYFMRVR
jgi:hypothetical protein